MRTGPRVRQGFMLLEFALGLTLVVALAGTLSVAAYHHRQGMDGLSAQRAATRLAERTLIALQAGRDTPEAGDRFRIETESMETADGSTWLRVTVTGRGESEARAALVGPAGGKAGGS